jgi:hypothetical protein
MEVPKKKDGAKGPCPTKAKPNKEASNFGAYLSSLNEKDFENVILRNGCKGALISKVHAKEVFILENGVCEKRLLIIRKTKEHKSERIHFILSNGITQDYTMAQLTLY